MLIDVNMLRLNTLTLCLLGAIVVLLLIVAYLYSTKGKENMGPVNPEAGKSTEKREQAPGPHPQGQVPQGPCLVLFRADWCGHCRALAPSWEEVKKVAADNRRLVIEVTDKDPELAKHSIKGFPTIRYYPEGLGNPGNFVEYTGERAAQPILQFFASQK